MSIRLRRREFIAALGGAAVAWPLAPRAQQLRLPVVGLIDAGAAEPNVGNAVAFRKGLGESGYMEGQNVTVEYHWLDGQYDRLPAVVADLVRRRVAVIATPGSTPAALAAKAATTTIPIVFGVAGDPVKLGLVGSLPRPGGNATGISNLALDLRSKRLELLHQLAPKAVRIAVLVNAKGPGGAESMPQDLVRASAQLGIQLTELTASTSGEIEAAYTALVRDQADALFVRPDPFFDSRRIHLVTLAARHGVPAAYPDRSYVEADGLISYGPDSAEWKRQVGVYVGRILNGTRPADLPVVQSTRFELAINLKTAKALGLIVPPTLYALATELIE
jgi:putative ABC transport system substrate-binding protein